MCDGFSYVESRLRPYFLLPYGDILIATWRPTSATSLIDLWFEDNVAALVALIRGQSRSEELGQMSGRARRLAAAFGSLIASKDSESHGISRDEDRSCRASPWHGWHLRIPVKCIGRSQEVVLWILLRQP